MGGRGFLEWIQGRAGHQVHPSNEQQVIIQTISLVVSNRLGLHGRPSLKLADVAGRFSSEIWAEKDREKYDCKSVMAMMLLYAGPGSTVHLAAMGPDAQEALAAIQDLFLRKFDEA
jgi:phosphocarrier protein